MFAFRASIGRSIAALLGGNNVKLFSNQLRQAPVASRSDIVSISVPELQSRRGFCDGFLHKRPENRNIRDHKRRLLAAKYELRRKLYKALTNDPELPPEIREKHRYKLSKLPRNSAFSRLRNRCIFTGRPRAVYEKFRMSRIVFRELASRGMLMGVKKASW